MCLAAARRLGARVSKRWCKQEGLYLEEIWEAAQSAELETDLWEMAGEEAEGDMENSGKKDTVEFNTIGKEHSSPLDYALASKYHHPTTITLRGHGCQLERKITGIYNYW